MHNNHIDYIEFSAINLEKTKEFYTRVFGWSFTDYGDTYTAFDKSGVKGGFQKVDKMQRGGPLVILYHENLKEAQKSVIHGGGTVTKDIFSFPGGRRFHFIDPSGNELAVWSDT